MQIFSLLDITIISSTITCSKTHELKLKEFGKPCHNIFEYYNTRFYLSFIIVS